MQNRLTIKDIARLSGVGKSTVSRVLNNESGVSERTRERVEAVMQQHGFSPSRSARAMRGQSDKVVAIIVTRLDSLSESASVVLWEIDLTEVGGDRYFFCNEQNEKGESVTWQSRQYQAYPIQGSGFEMNGKGSAARPTLTVSNLHGMITGMAEDLQSLVGGTVVRRKVYARFLDAVNFVNGNRDADPEQEVISRWRIEQCSELSAVSASFVLSTPTETDGAVFPGRIMLANTCTWTYRGDECGYSGPAVADEYDQPTSDITKDKCSKCLSGCKFRNNVGNFGGFLSINKLSQ